MSSAVALSPERSPHVVRDVIALGKPRLSVLVLVTTGAGILVAPGRLSLPASLLAIAATSLLVAAANTLNSYLERDVDALMLRTRNRPLPAGRVTPNLALVVGIVGACVALPVLFAATNLLTALLGLAAFVIYVAIYTPLKRRTAWALFIGAVPGAMPALMGWTAVTGRLDLPGASLFALLFVWQLPHFLAIAFYLLDDYGRAGLRVFSLVHGPVRTKQAVIASGALLLPVSLGPWLAGIAPVSFAIVALVLGLGLFAVCLGGLRPDAGNRWAKSVFLGSTLYLTVLYAVLVMTSRIGGA